jgi:replicative DNA helicase
VQQAARYLKVVEGGDALSRAEGDYTVDVLARTAERMAEASGAPPLIILDYLQRMPVPAELRIKDTRERVSYMAGQLQVTLARGLGCPVLALSSVGRAAYRLGKADLEGRLAAFKEAGEFEYTAYTADRKPAA